MKQRIVIATLCIVAVVFGVIGYLRYMDHRFLQAVSPHVKNTSLRIANAARFETEENNNVTFKEIFDKLEWDICEIDKHIFEVQTIATSDNKELAAPILAYLKGGQELLRSLLIMNRRVLAVSTSKDWADRAISDQKNANPYGADILYRTTTTTALDRYSRCKRECDEATLDVLRALTKMKEVRPKVGQILSSDALADPAIFDQVIKKLKAGHATSNSQAGA